MAGLFLPEAIWQPDPMASKDGGSHSCATPDILNTQYSNN